MPRFLDTTGNSNLAVGLCGRCHMKRPIVKLVPDPNVPGLMVCGDNGPIGNTYGSGACRDGFDPYRLPARQPDKINLRFARPDVPLIPEE